MLQNFIPNLALYPSTKQPERRIEKLKRKLRVNGNVTYFVIKKRNRICRTYVNSARLIMHISILCKIPCLEASMVRFSRGR